MCLIFATMKMSNKFHEKCCNSNIHCRIGYRIIVCESWLIKSIFNKSPAFPYVLDQLALAAGDREVVHEDTKIAAHSVGVGCHLNPVKLAAVWTLVVNCHSKLRGTADLIKAEVVAIFQQKTPGELVQGSQIEDARVEVAHVDDGAAVLAGSSAHFHIDLA